MHRLLAPSLGAFLVVSVCGVAGAAPDRVTMIGVAGAPGAPEYGTEFARWAGLWEALAGQAGASWRCFGKDSSGEIPDRQRLQEAIDSEPKEGSGALWLILLGHGTFDGNEAKFNLRGPDVSSAELAAWLAPFKRPLVIIDCSASSAPFINHLSGPGRIVVTATKSGYEQNYARFGGYLAEALSDSSADLDKDGQTSLLEAFLQASGRTAEFYRVEGRLATETALIDDNGDGLGTPGAWFSGVRAVKRARDGAALDGARAHQVHLIPGAAEKLLPPDVRARRDALELEVAALRDAKERGMAEDEYYAKLEVPLLALARLYAEWEKSTKGVSP